MIRRLGQAAACVCLLSLGGCASRDAQTQALADGTVCAKRGYLVGTDVFAGCTFNAAARRNNRAVAERLNREQEAVYLRRRQETLRQLSVARNGDFHFPICDSASPSAQVDRTTYAWYGEGCREK